MIRYMISYIDSDPPRVTNGNVEYNSPGPIRSMEDIQELTQTLRERFGLANPIVMGFSRFDDEAGN